jgi:hypothetical protein
VTSATAQARPEPESGFSKARLAFRNWRRSRPFWGGLLVLLAGLPIIYFPYNNLTVGTISIRLATSAGAASLVIGLLLISIGVSVWFQPMIRVFGGIATLVLSLASIPMSNLGGFGLGLIPGLLGGALVLSWAPLKQPKEAVAEDTAVAEPEAQEEEWTADVPGFEPRLLDPAAAQPTEPEAAASAPQPEEGTDGGE